jgi:CRISPR/Cas system-associated exonuclease Cas4 (RecB family)
MTELLPATFQFSQANFQDYVDCPRRFQLRYVLMQPWPGLITGSPDRLESHLQRGADFHRLAHQHALGLAHDRLAATIHDEDLAHWWQTYQDHPPRDLPETLRWAEVVVAAPLAGYRLAAKFDLLAVEPGVRLVIVDWKTVLRRPSRSTLARRLQTTVYRYLAVEAGTSFNDGRPPQPEQVEMMYWFAEFPGVTEHFPYDSGQHDGAREYLAGLVHEIAAHQGTIWPLTSDHRFCRFCNYRTLCERDVRPAFLEELEDDLELGELEIDLEQIAEVVF